MRCLRAAVAACALAALLGACNDDETPKADAPTASTGGRPHPLGFKWDLPRVDRYAEFLGSVAGGATFTEVVWCDVEPSPGDYDWSLPDRIVAKAVDLGARVFLKLRVGSCWANDDRGGAERGVNRRRTASAIPHDLDAYRTFVRDAVRRYESVEQFAIENEVNSPSFWSSTVDDYRALVGTAAAVIRAERPSARVFDSGISSVGYGVAIAAARLESGDADGAVDVYRRYYARRFSSRDEFPDIEDAAALRAVLASDEARRHRSYLDVALQLARDDQTDGIQLHFYEPADAAPDLVEYVTSAGGGAPVEAWEVGLFWPGDPEPGDAADEALRSVAGLLGAGVRQVIWLPMAHNPDGRRAEEVRLGAVNADASLRPLGLALAEAAAALSGVGAGIRFVPLRAGFRGFAAVGAEGEAAVVWSGNDRPRVLSGGRGTVASVALDA